MKRGLLLTIALIVCCAGLVSAAELQVPAQYPTIQDAVDAADPATNDVVVVADGTYTGPGNNNIDFAGKAITVKSLNGPENCIIDAGEAARAFYFHTGEIQSSRVEGFTITNGYDYNFGGAIECDSSSPTIANCIFENCKSYDGGAIDFYQSDAVLVDCIFTGNFAENAGGAVSIYESNVIVKNCLFANNSAEFGAIDVYLSSPIIQNCTIAGSLGGGINADSSSNAEITNSIFADNSDLDMVGCSATYSRVSDLAAFPGYRNIDSEPLFVTGPKGGYYLSQLASGQPVDSPCIDAGEGTINLLAGTLGYTTSSASIADADAIDMGYHYPDTGAPTMVKLTTVVEGNGAIDPNLAQAQEFPAFSQIELAAIPAQDHRVEGWTVAGAGAGLEYTGDEVENIVSLGAEDATVTVSFALAEEFLTLVDDTENGSLSVDPAGTLQSDGTLAYINGEVVTVTATPVMPYVIEGWYIDDQQLLDADGNPYVEPTYDLLMDASHEVRVEYDRTYRLSARIGTGQGAVEPSRGSYLAGDTAVVTAAPVKGNYPDDRYVLTQWLVTVGRSAAVPVVVDVTATALIEVEIAPGVFATVDPADPQVINVPMVDNTIVEAQCRLLEEPADTLTWNTKLINHATYDDGAVNGSVTPADGADYLAWNDPHVPDTAEIQVQPNMGWTVSSWGDDVDGDNVVDAGSEFATDELTAIAVFDQAKTILVELWPAVEVAGTNAGRFVTIQEAIDAAESGTVEVLDDSGNTLFAEVPGDQIILDDQVYQGAGNVDLDFAGKIITLSSAGGDPNKCIIDCEQNASGFVFSGMENQQSVIEGISVINANGSAVRTSGISSPLFRNCVFRNGFGSDGGAVANYRTEDPAPLIQPYQDVYDAAVAATTADPATDDPAVEAALKQLTQAQSLADTEGMGPLFSNCVLTQNMASNFGGAVYSEHGPVNLYNCLITENRANSFGAIYLDAANSEIMFCTIVGNSGAAYGDRPRGGIVAVEGAAPVISHCIIGHSDGNMWQNWRQPNVQSSDDLVGCQAAWSCVEYLDGDETVTDTTNTTGDPQFAVGPVVIGYMDAVGQTIPLNQYYISQPPEHPVASSAYNAGDPDAAAWNDLVGIAELGLSGQQTTSIITTPDFGRSDLGYHYPEYTGDPILRQIVLQVLDSGGTMTYEYDDGNTTNPDAPDNVVTFGNPVTLQVVPGTQIDLTAVPNNQYRVYYWLGTDDDTTFSTMNTMTVYNDGQQAAVEFELSHTSLIHVPVQYTDIQSGIDAARDGDIVIVSPGLYRLPLMIAGKDITLRGEFPDDPDRWPIIDVLGQGNHGLTVLGSYSGTGMGQCLIDGFDIRNARMNAGTVPGPQGEGANGNDGSDNFGGGLVVMGDHTIMNCSVSDSWFVGASASGGNNGGNEVARGGNGGWGGAAVAGGIYIGAGSPLLKNVTVENCYVQGGNGANGANGSQYGRGGDGGCPGQALGGAVYVGNLFNPALIVSPTFVDCSFIGSRAMGANGGDGGDRGSDGERNGYGGVVTVTQQATLTPPDRPQGDARLYTSKGGAVYCGQLTQSVFENCEFIDNWTESGLTGVGSSAYAERRQPFERYPIPTAGGGVFVEIAGSVDFSGCLFENNSNTTYEEAFTGYGGGLCTGLDYDQEIGPLAGEGLTPNVDVTIEKTVFRGNTSTVGGGGYGANLVHMDIADCNFVDNGSYLGGGLMLVKGQDIRMSDSLFARNQAYDTNDGEGVAIGDNQVINRGVGGGLSVINSVFLGKGLKILENRSTGSAGGLYLAGHPESLITPTYYNLAKPLLWNCLIADNDAGVSGAGVFCNFEVDAAFRSCTIADNSVLGGQSQGGGIFVAYGSAADFTDSIIWGNNAAMGAQITVDSESIQVADGTADFWSRLDAEYVDVGPFPEPNNITIHDAFADLDFSSVFSAASGTSLATVVDKQEIDTRFESSAWARVIVTLRDAPELIGSTDFSSEIARQALRAEVTDRLDNIITTMDATELQIKNRCENIPVFSGMVTQRGLDKLRTNPSVAFIEPARQVSPMLRQSVDLANATIPRQFYNGQGISIAIVDSGVDYTHPMLGGGPDVSVQFPNDKVIGGYDTGSGDADPMPVIEPHGTACAGIAGGMLGEIEDYIGGVAYNAKLYALKIADDSGAFMSDAGIEAWDWCITHQYDDPDNPIMVISNSWGGFIPYEDAEEADRNNPALAAASRVANAAGITVMAASGNSKEFLPVGISSPAALSTVLSVGALYDETGEVTEYSQTGELLDILAPADPMYTTDMVGQPGYDPGDYTAYFNGTSSATPFAAGCVAAIQSAAMEKLDTYLTPGQVKELLTMTGIPTADGTYPDITRPAIDLASAIINLTGAPPILIEDGSYVNGERIYGWDPNTDFFDDPAVGIGNSFVADPLFVGDYYLSQIEAGQLVTSPAVDAGSGPVDYYPIAMQNHHTRTDGVNDIDTVDLGYHHAETNVVQYELTAELNYPETMLEQTHIIIPEQGVYPHYKTVKLQVQPALPENFAVRWTGTDDDEVAGEINYVTMDDDKHVTAEIYSELPILIVEVLTDNGTVSIVENDGSLSPAGVTVHQQGEEVKLVAHPDVSTHRVSWAGTDDDSTGSTQNTVTIDGNTLVQVKFYEPRTMEVGGDFTELQYAIYDARDGDTIIMQPAVYEPVQGVHLVIDKAITIQSINPEDPDVVANTVIQNCGFVISDTDRDTVLNGITIRDAHYIGGNGCPGLTNCNPLPDGMNGVPVEGGGIEFMDGASATIKNCNFVSCSVRGGHGGDGGQGGDGGWGGWARGGAAYVGMGGSPIFINCEFIDNEAFGGNGGNGGGPNGTRGGSWDEVHNPWPDWDYGPYLEYWKYSGYGGAIYCDAQSTPEFVDCYFSGNTAHGSVTGRGVNLYPWGHYQIETYGGAIYAAKGSAPRFDNCVFDDNEADRVGQETEQHDEGTITEDPYFAFGGAVAFEHESMVEFTNCDFNRNASHDGGAIYGEWAYPVIADCNFVGNSGYHGGALYYNNGGFTVENTTFRGNYANFQTDGLGGAIYASDANSLFNDIIVQNNSATGAGGGIYFLGSGKSTIDNALITNNSAYRYGGGFMANWYAQAQLTSCTISENSVAGTSSLGGGIAVANGSEVEVDYSIIWDNSSVEGESAAVFTGIGTDAVTAQLAIDYSDVRHGLAGTMVYPECVINWGSNNIGSDLIHDDPLFTNGPLGDFYLKQDAVISPCVNFGNISAVEAGLYPRTTNKLRNSFDEGKLDLGYHYAPSEQGMPEDCRICDLNIGWATDSIGRIDLYDQAIYEQHWERTDCTEANGWCEGADFNYDGAVDVKDLAIWTSCWLEEDLRAPIPDPTQWGFELEPHVVEDPDTGESMVLMGAFPAFDSWSGFDQRDTDGDGIDDIGVMYEFECTNYPGHSRMLPESRTDWTADIREVFMDPNYIDTDYVDGFAYQYRVRTVDPRGNRSKWSMLSNAGQEVRPIVEWLFDPQSIYTDATPVEMYAQVVDENGEPLYDDATTQYYYMFYRRPFGGTDWEPIDRGLESIDFEESDGSDTVYLGMLTSQNWTWLLAEDYGFSEPMTYNGAAAIDDGLDLVVGDTWEYKVVVTKIMGELKIKGELTAMVVIGTSNDNGDFTGPVPNPPAWSTYPTYVVQDGDPWHYMAVEPVADEETPDAVIIYEFQSNTGYETQHRTDDDTLVTAPNVLKIAGPWDSTRQYRVRAGTEITLPDGTVKRVNWGDWTAWSSLRQL